jgi:hypothetical protein
MSLPGEKNEGRIAKATPRTFTGRPLPIQVPTAFVRISTDRRTLCLEPVTGSRRCRPRRQSNAHF